MPLVAVITRTKNRPLMLARAAESVRRQNFPDLEWVIVNDGGPQDPVDEIAEATRGRGISVRVLHNDTSLGMQAASNHGISHSDSELIAIHDDDDTWENAFLTRTSAFLPMSAREDVTRGVVTRMTLVHERIESDRIVQTRRGPFDDNLVSVTLFQMARFHLIPAPISFLFRRNVLPRIGLYREQADVLGDWEFYLRFLSHYDIGVIPERLANYHLRTGLYSGPYGNTVIAGVEQHAACGSRLRNEMLRQDLEQGKMGLGFIVNLAHELNVMRLEPSLARKILRRILPHWLQVRLIQLWGL